jgi:hypothetical protein
VVLGRHSRCLRVAETYRTLVYFHAEVDGWASRTRINRESFAECALKAGFLTELTETRCLGGLVGLDPSAWQNGVPASVFPTHDHQHVATIDDNSHSSNSHNSTVTLATPWAKA